MCMAMTIELRVESIHTRRQRIFIRVTNRISAVVLTVKYYNYYYYFVFDELFSHWFSILAFSLWPRVHVCACARVAVCVWCLCKHLLVIYKF